MSYTYFNISDKLRLYEFEGLLDQYGDATAAYSLRKLRNDYTGSAIRVRRSSDNAERDMGFYDNELDTVALLDWVNQEVNIADYNVISNVGNTIATKIAPFTYNATSDGNGGSTIRPKISFTTTTAGNSYQLIITPSNQSGTINFKLYDGSSYIITGNDLSAGIDTTFTANGGVFIAFDGTQIFNVDFTIELNALSADGHVQTWYDQSANANHAVQNTDTAQPKIVDAGTLVTEGGKPTITFDGVDDNFTSSYGPVSDPNISVIGVLNMNGNNQSFLHADGMVSDGFKVYLADYTYAATLMRTNIDANGTQTFLAFHANGANSTLKAKNPSGEDTQTADLTGTTWTNIKNIGSRGGSIHPMLGDISELIIYGTSKQSVSDDIEFNINTYYSIY